MNIVENEYQRFLRNGDRARIKAENAYKNQNYTEAVKHYYHASLAYEQAKSFADEFLEVTHKIFAQDMEHCCQEKLDELKRFRGVSTEEAIR